MLLKSCSLVLQSGSKIPMKLNPWIQKTMIHGGTMSSVNDYMAINHAYRSKHSYGMSISFINYDYIIEF